MIVFFKELSIRIKDKNFDFQISEDDFYNFFKPIKNNFVDDSCFSNCMFETYGEEFDFVKKHSQSNKVWTIVDGDNESLLIVAGMRLVNRLGYILTDEPWINENLWWEDK